MYIYNKIDIYIYTPKKFRKTVNFNVYLTASTYNKIKSFDRLDLIDLIRTILNMVYNYI